MSSTVLLIIRHIKSNGIVHGVLFVSYLVAHKVLAKLNYHISIGYNISYVFEKWYALYTAKKLESKGLGNVIAERNLCSRKDSNKLFVLGSGSSINDISRTKWNHIEGHDSIGINRWPLHDHVPDLYVFELPSWSESEYANRFWTMLRHKWDDYKNSTIIVKGVGVANIPNISRSNVPRWFWGEAVIAKDVGFTSAVPWDAARDRHLKLLQLLKIRGIFDKKNFSVQYKKRGTISFVLGLALQMGYEEVILCGVDMNNNDYFFEQESPDNCSDQLPVPGSSNEKRADSEGVHPTVDSNRGALTLDKVILDLESEVLDPNSVSLYVESEVSALYPQVDLYQ